MRFLFSSRTHRRAALLGGLALALSIPASAQGWQVHEGPAEKFNFGRVIPNGDNAGFLSGAQVPSQSDPGWSSASSDFSLRWGGQGGTPCRARANYTYFQTDVFPTATEGYELSFLTVDDAAEVKVYNEIHPDGASVPGGVLGLRERRAVDVTGALLAGATNRIVVTLADVCGAGNAIALQMRAIPGTPMTTTAAPSEPTMVVDGVEVRTGAIQLTLEWARALDLDLHVTDPGNETVSYSNKNVSSGGFLDVDSYGSCEATTGGSVENIVWPTNTPEGAYSVRVHNYDSCRQGGSEAYTLTLRHNGQEVRRWQGSLAHGAEATHTFSVLNGQFTF